MTEWHCVICPAHGLVEDMRAAFLASFWHYEDEHREG